VRNFPQYAKITIKHLNNLDLFGVQVVVKNEELIAVYSVSGASERQLKLDLAATIPFTDDLRESFESVI
jgi:hypothetical protein